MTAAVEITCTLNCRREKPDGSVVRLVRCSTCTEGRDAEVTEGEVVKPAPEERGWQYRYRYKCGVCNRYPAAFDDHWATPGEADAALRSHVLASHTSDSDIVVTRLWLPSKQSEVQQ